MTVKNGHLPRGCWANLHFPLKTAFDYRIPEDEVKLISACSQSLFSASSLISSYINIFSFLWSVFGGVFFNDQINSLGLYRSVWSIISCSRTHCCSSLVACCLLQRGRFYLRVAQMWSFFGDRGKHWFDFTCLAFT